MPNETDLPCTDCGSALEEQTVTLLEREGTDTSPADIRVAVCPDCGATHYPEQTLTKLTDTAESHGGERVDL